MKCKPVLYLLQKSLHSASLIQENIGESNEITTQEAHILAAAVAQIAACCEELARSIDCSPIPDRLHEVLPPVVEQRLDELIEELS